MDIRWQLSYLFTKVPQGTESLPLKWTSNTSYCLVSNILLMFSGKCYFQKIKHRKENAQECWYCFDKQYQKKLVLTLQKVCTYVWLFTFYNIICRVKANMFCYFISYIILDHQIQVLICCLLLFLKWMRLYILMSCCVFAGGEEQQKGEVQDIEGDDQS